MEALGERRIDIACVQEIWWRGSSCRYFGATGKRYKLKEEKTCEEFRCMVGDKVK